MSETRTQISTTPEANESDIRVLALVQSAETESMFIDFIHSVCPDQGEVLRLSLDQSMDYLEKNDVPPYVIVDIGGASDPLTCVRDIAGTVPPSVTLMIVGDRQDVDFYRAITHGFGIAEYLYHPLVQNLVVRFFGGIILHGQKFRSAANGGSFILMTGVRDGVGVSTILANLGWCVAEELKRHTLLVDFNLQSSKLGLLLNAENNSGLQAVLETPDRMDGLLIERSTQVLSDRLHLLAAVGPILNRPRIAPATSKALIEFVRTKFHFIMAESSWRDGDMYLALLEEAQQLIFVLDPTLISIRDTLRALAALPKGSLPTRPIYVLNNYGRPGTLSMEEVCKSLNLQPDVVIPYMPKDFGEAEINGQPLISQNVQFRNAMMLLAQTGLSVHVPGQHSQSGWRGRISALFSKLRRK
ncbi:AAA family ATPase [Acetobacter ghanensis]|uniref:Pilus assembly protein n=1 Tax=Acetobacter ghanensis TaxID=431306 RepID=A0A0U5F178_9PROT|nr:hypothetical protein [Acetobacter ghanensis]NHO40115.1 pilus assembly protein [Acetobacter ghanensis]GBQ45742.1 Flp pilus assembly protein CpaE [Acetobacter ghanensis DSM 18895]CEF54144.1 putative pilus assembly protein [Acetobacter ghanensis]